MRNGRMIGLLLGGIALCSLLLWLTQGRGYLLAPKQARAVRLFEEPPAEVREIEVERGVTRVGVRRAGRRWQLYAPFAAEVEQGAIMTLLDALEEARVHDILPVHELRRRELSLASLGLMPAVAQLKLIEPGYCTVIRFGRLTPSGKECYLQIGDDEVMVVPASTYAALPANADELRSRRLTPALSAEVRGIEIRNPGHPFIALSRNDEGNWHLTQPLAEAADNHAVAELLERLYTARVDRFIWPSISNVLDVALGEADFKAKLEFHGLNQEQGLQVRLFEENGDPLKLIFGRTIEGAGELCALLLPEHQAIAAVSNSLMESLRLEVEALRDRHPFRSVRGSIRSLSLGFDGEQWLLSQTNGIWRFEAPAAELANQERVNLLLRALFALEADEIVSRVDGADGGLEETPPISSIEIISDEGRWHCTLEAHDIARASLDLVVTNAPLAYRIASARLPQALLTMRGVLQLRSKRMLDFMPDTARRVTIRRQGRQVALFERAGGSWHKLAASEPELEAQQIDELINRLGKLEALSVVEVNPGATRLTACGLSEPWLEISVDLEAENALRKTLLLGHEVTPGQRYAMVRGSDILYVVEGHGP